MSRFKKIHPLLRSVIFFALFIIMAMIPHRGFAPSGPPAASMSDYTAYPAFVTEGAPPLVMLAMGRDHKIYYEAYNDASDLDGDGRLDVGYKDTIDYYGYFDANKCYTYGSSVFTPTAWASGTNNHYCSGAWSGNFLNWLSMSRMDIIRKIFYGGYRSQDDSAKTYLEGSHVPQDAHSWGKEYAGSDTNQLTPFGAPGSGKKHLFCMTSLDKDKAHIIRVLQNRSERIWQWASVERPVCANAIDTDGDGDAENSVSPSDYEVRVEVCKSGLLEDNCKLYEHATGVYKPIGLLQKYGEGDGTGTKVCSKNFSKECTGDSDCGTGEGRCVGKAQMYFGLMTGSYTKNLSGGVLRKNVWSIGGEQFDKDAEINVETGVFKRGGSSDELLRGSIINTIDNMKTIGFRYSDYSYQDPSGGNCGWITTRALQEGECIMWGNPMAEILYEATRYFADKGSPTSSFTYASSEDMGLKLPKPSWIKPYETYATCAKPFVLAFSDINPSYDSNQVPGTSFGSFSGDLSDLNVTTLTNTIGTSEGIPGDYFIGQSGSLNDFICSKKYVSNLGTIRGLCPEEPTKQGSFYSAAVSHYGRTMMQSKTGKPNISTYAVALSSPIPDINIKVGSSNVRLVPTGKSASGCLGVHGACVSKCTITYGGNGLSISNCDSDAYCPTNQIVDFYVEDIQYDSNNNLTSAKFRINFEDVEQGADHDMDAIVFYEICTGSSCSPVIGANEVKVKLTSQYGAGCIDQALGFTISGTTEDGLYLPVKDADVPNFPDFDTHAVVAGMPLTWSKTFTVSGSPAGVLKDPLWYAAKWGGFEDLNNNGVLDDPKEWDANGDGVPDTYFLAINPLKLEQQLDKVFTEMVRRTASGTALSVLSITGEGEGAVYQAYFYPKKMEGLEERKWLGHIHGLFVDVYGNLREDTNGNKTLDYDTDYIIKTVYDSSEGTKAEKYTDTNGDGKPDAYVGKVPIENVVSIWNGGRKLWEIKPSERKIYSTTDGYTRIEFTESSKSTLRPFLRASTDTEAGNIIKYIRGGNEDHTDVAGYRKRTVTVDGQTKVWKLGDIVYSTPTSVSKPMENYDLIYGDQSYYNFRKTYLNRRHVIYVGANDGMLHALNGGFYDPLKHKFCGAYGSGNTCPDTDSLAGELGKELWGFIPREALPHLKWLTDPDYTHVYYVDLKPKVADVKIFSCDATHVGATGDTTCWGTILIGGMRYGGKAIKTEKVAVGSGKETEYFRSTYFALDITDPEQAPRLLWTFDTTDAGEKDDVGLTLSYPTVMKVNSEWYVIFGAGPKNFDKQSNLTELNADGNVFVLKISGGNNGVIQTWTKNTNYWKKITTHHKAFLANPIALDVNTDYNVDVAYIGENYIVSSKNKAVLLRLNTKNSTDPSAWILSSLYDVTSTSDKIKRITAAPSAALDGKGNLWVYFGTGQYLGSLDKNAVDSGAFYGIKDGCWDGNCSTTYSDLVDVSNVVINYGDTVAFNSVVQSVGSKAGWVIYFGTMSSETVDFLGNTLTHAGERVTSKPVVLSGFVMFATYVPGTDICTAEGKTNLYVLYYQTGTAHTRYIFKAEKAAELGKPGPQTVSRVALLGQGLPTSIGLMVTREGAMKGFVQTSTGEIYQIQELDPTAPKPQYTGWKVGGLGGL